MTTVFPAFSSLSIRLTSALIFSRFSAKLSSPKSGPPAASRTRTKATLDAPVSMAYNWAARSLTGPEVTRMRPSETCGDPAGGIALGSRSSTRPGRTSSTLGSWPSSARFTVGSAALRRPSVSVSITCIVRASCELPLTISAAARILTRRASIVPKRSVASLCRSCARRAVGWRSPANLSAPLACSLRRCTSWKWRDACDRSSCNGSASPSAALSLSKSRCGGSIGYCFASSPTDT